MKLLSYSILLFTLLSSCTNINSSPKNTEFENLENVLNKIDPTILENYSTVLLIPREGCGGCISDATAYIKEKIDFYKGCIIFTTILDKKQFKLTVNEEFINRKNVFEDYDNHTNIPQIESVYPRVLFISNKKISTIKNFEKSLLALD